MLTFFHPRPPAKPAISLEQGCWSSYTKRIYMWWFYFRIVAIWPRNIRPFEYFIYDEGNGEVDKKIKAGTIRSRLMLFLVVLYFQPALKNVIICKMGDRRKFFSWYHLSLSLCVICVSVDCAAVWKTLKHPQPIFSYKSFTLSDFYRYYELFFSLLVAIVSVIIL